MSHGKHVLGPSENSASHALELYQHTISYASKNRSATDVTVYPCQPTDHRRNPLGECLKARRRHCNPNSAPPSQLEIRGKYLPHIVNGGIVNHDCFLRVNRRGRSSSEAAQRKAGFAMSQVPNHLPRRKTAYHAQQDPGSWLHEAGEIARYLGKVPHAV